jgi:hypothetical protein
MDRLDPLDESLAERLPPLLDSKILVFRRGTDAEARNNQLGGECCRIFPGLRATLKRLAEDQSSDEEWEAPFADDEERQS